MTSKGHAEFVVEAQEITDALNHDLILAESQVRDGDVEPGLINRLFRSAHSLKGISGMFGLEAVSRLAHEMETLLDAMRLGRVPVGVAALDVLFACVERFGVLISDVEKGVQSEASVVDDLVGRILEVTAGSDTEKQIDELSLVELAPEILKVLTEYEEHRLRENISKGHALFLLHTSFDLSNFDAGLEELDVALRGKGEIITKLPSAQGDDPNVLAFDILVGSSGTKGDIIATLGNDKIDVNEVARREAPSPVSAKEFSEPSESPEALPSVRSVSRTVRVDIRRLDRLMNLVGELALTRAEIHRLSEELRREQGFSPLAAALHKEGRHFERRLSELQAGIMDVRMVPLTNLFERMVRAGRKIAKDLHRTVRIDVSGESTELDKLIVEDLADPLMHVIRNAIDHGIESPEDRERLGKSAEGNVHLHAAAQGNHVIVQVRDDGRGVSVDALKARAIERGIITSERAAEMTRREALALMFVPGFSTRDSVSEFSGRGVGMDVVKTNIAKLSGIVDIDSEEGNFTTLTITLPITLAIIPALIVGSSERTFAMPLNNVKETLSLAETDESTIERRRVISLRGTTVPLLDLRELFELGGEADRSSGYAIIAGAGQSTVALAVDDVSGQQDIVIKSLGKRMRGVRGIAGAAELANQKTILVVDVVELLNELQEVEAASERTESN